MERNDACPAPQVLHLPPGAGLVAGRPPADVELEEGPRDLRDYLWVLYKYRWLAGTCFGAALGMALLVTLVTPRRYTAATRLQVARQAPIQLRLEDNVRRLDEAERSTTEPTTFVATQVAALQSRDLAERVIRKHRLAENELFLHPTRGPREAAVPTPAGLLAALRPRGWEIEPADARHDNGDASGAIDPVLLDRYAKWLRVSDLHGTDLLEVSFTTPSPRLSAFLVAAHTQAYIEANQEAQHATDVVANEFLEQQLRETRKQVEHTERGLARFASQHPRVAANEEQKTVSARIGDLTSLLTKAEGERATLESRYEFVNRRDAEPLAYFLDRPGIQKLRLALLDIRAERAGLDQRLGPNHPRIQGLLRLETELERQLAAEVKQAVDGVRSHYDAARARENQLRRKLAQVEKAGLALGTLGTRYALLKNDVETARALHASLLKQRRDTAVHSELAATNIRVVERAEIPQRPSRPKVLLDLTLGVLGGLLLGIGGALLREYFDRSIKTSEEAEQLLRLPTLATIPNFALALSPAVPRAWSRRGNGSRADGGMNGARIPTELVVTHEPWSQVAEAFRSMRTAVLFSNAPVSLKVILVTSAGSGEGKTVASLNLASTISDADARVLLVDADLRHPRCHISLGVGNERGLSTILGADRADEFESLIVTLAAPTLSFLPAGPPPDNPAELLGSARMRRLLDALRDRYDFVVLDTPPVLPVTDAVVLAREADGVVLVVKGHDTPRELVRRARDRLVLAGAHFLGVMINNVGLGWDERYFYDPYARYARSRDGERRSEHRVD